MEEVFDFLGTISTCLDHAMQQPPGQGLHSIFLVVFMME